MKKIGLPHIILFIGFICSSNLLAIPYLNLVGTIFLAIGIGLVFKDLLDKKSFLVFAITLSVILLAILYQTFRQGV